ncbi:putative ribonuclease H-like domain-containing protein [Tanacetum coccineum]
MDASNDEIPMRLIMGDVDINMLTMEQYMASTRGNRPGVGIRDHRSFHILDVTQDAIMLRMFPITLRSVARRWKNMLPAGLINTWDLLEKAFIQKYCPPLKTSKKLEEIHNFKQEMDETLYQA